MKRKGNHFLSVIVPVYKQEGTIVKNIKQLKKVLETIRYDYEIITVVDGIVDNSFKKIHKAHISKVRCIVYKKNQGKSYAIRTGMHHALGDYVMFIDAGMEIDPNGMAMLVEHLEWYDADIIVGSKRHPASQIEYSLSRKLLSYGYYIFVKALFRVTVKDTQAGIKIMRKKALKKILPRLIEKKFAGDLEILAVAHRLGIRRIYEAPIKLDYGLSKLTSAATLQSVLGIFIDTLAIFYRAYILRYYEKSHRRYKKPKDLKIYSY